MGRFDGSGGGGGGGGVLVEGGSLVEGGGGGGVATFLAEVGVGVSSKSERISSAMSTLSFADCWCVCESLLTLSGFLGGTTPDLRAYLAVRSFFLLGGGGGRAGVFGGTLTVTATISISESGFSWCSCEFGMDDGTDDGAEDKDGIEGRRVVSSISVCGVLRQSNGR